MPRMWKIGPPPSPDGISRCDAEMFHAETQRAQREPIIWADCFWKPTERLMTPRPSTVAVVRSVSLRIIASARPQARALDRDSAPRPSCRRPRRPSHQMELPPPRRGTIGVHPAATCVPPDPTRSPAGRVFGVHGAGRPFWRIQELRARALKSPTATSVTPRGASPSAPRDDWRPPRRNLCSP